MAKEFRETAREWSSPNLKKNTFDKTFTHPMTAELGKLYPVFVDTMSPNTSMRVSPSWSFKFKPFIQDMQSVVKAHFSLWRVPVRILWDNFKTFTRQDPTTARSHIVHPFISREHFTGIGTLADYFGIPCQTYSSAVDGVWKLSNGFGGFTGTSMSDFGRVTGKSAWELAQDNGADKTYAPTTGVYRVPVGMFCTDNTTNLPAPRHGAVCARGTRSSSQVNIMDFDRAGYSLKDFLAKRNSGSVYVPNGIRTDDYSDLSYVNYCVFEQPLSNPLHKMTPAVGSDFYGKIRFRISRPVVNDVQDSNNNYIAFMVFGGSTPDDAILLKKYRHQSVAWLPNYESVDITTTSKPVEVQFHPFEQGSTQEPKTTSLVINVKTINLKLKQLEELNKLQETYGNLWFVLFDCTNTLPANYFLNPFFSASIQTRTATQMVVPACGQTFHNYTTYVNGAENIDKVNAAGGFLDIEYYCDAPYSVIVNTPFDGLQPECPVSALPFRAMEAVYNYKFRIKELDPFMKNGVIAVDDWNTNHDDGADSTTPVDINDYRVSYSDDYFFGCMPKPTGYDYQMEMAGVMANSPDTDVQVIEFASTGGQTYNVRVHVGQDGTISGIDSYDETAEKFTIDALKEGIKYGITPAAITYANALNKWYEATYKGGRYTYQGFIDAHFGHPATHNGLQNPEFIGGCTRSLDMESVANTTANGQVPLGYSAGVGSFTKDDNSGWTIYTDEECIVLGLLYFTVEPINNQSIHKFWLRSQPMDYPTPELANLGVMEVKKKEITPLQCTYGAGGDSEQTFGYNNNYADMTHNWDYASGLYRTDYSHMLFQRIYGVPPEISADLLKIRGEELTCPYADGNYKDPLYGVIHFDCMSQIWLNQEANQIIM